MCKYTSVRDAVEGELDLMMPRRLAEALNINDAHIYRARQGDYTPTLIRALKEQGLITKFNFTDPDDLAKVLIDQDVEYAQELMFAIAKLHPAWALSIRLIARSK